MKKFYTAPELELVKITLTDVILNSNLEETIGEEIGGEGGGDIIDLGGL